MLKLDMHLMDNGLTKRLLKDEQASRKAIESTMRELRKRAPVKVAQAVAKVYAIKQSEVKPGGDGMAGGSRVRTQGRTISEFALVYTGRLLTPQHFKMSPTSPLEDGRKYTIKATIKKGHRVTIGRGGKPGSYKGKYSRSVDSPYFLQHANGAMLPFMRKAGSVDLDGPFKTLSIPQMVGNEEVAEPALKEIGELAAKRLEHNLERNLARL